MRATVGRPAIDEKATIDRILKGDRDLYALLVREHQAHLYQLCLAFLGDPHEAEEATQVAFLKAFGSLGGFRGSSSFRTWLTRIGINQCKDELHRRRRRVWVPLDEVEGESRRLPLSLVHMPEEALPETRRIPPAAFKRLSPNERKVLEWVGENPKTDYSVIGGHLGWSVDSVKGRLKRAREKVRAYLSRHGDEN